MKTELRKWGNFTVINNIKYVATSIFPCIHPERKSHDLLSLISPFFYNLQNLRPQDPNLLRVSSWFTPSGVRLFLPFLKNVKISLADLFFSFQLHELQVSHFAAHYNAYFLFIENCKTLMDSSGVSRLTTRNPHCFFGFCFFFFFCLFRAAPAAYGSTQARGQIGVVAAGLPHSHSNLGSELRLRPTPQLTATLDSRPIEWGQGSNPHPHGY